MLEYFKSAKASVFRFEQFQTYLVEEDEDYTAMQEWLDFVGSRITGLITWQRVRVVEYPMNEYTQDELEFFKRTVAVGADIRAIDFLKFSELKISLPDFWLIDNKIVLEMNYSRKGEFIDFTLKRTAISKFLQAKQDLLHHSIPLKSTFRLE